MSPNNDFWVLCVPRTTGQQIALMARIAVEEIEALADELVGAEMREQLAHIPIPERLIRVSVALFM